MHVHLYKNILHFFFAGLDIKILTCLEQIKAQVHQNTRMLQEIMGRIEGTSPVTTVDHGEDHDLPDFPLRG